MRVLFNRCIVLFVFYFFIFFQIKSQELFFKSEIGNSVNVSQIIVANSIRKDTFNKQHFSSFNISSFVNCDTISILINDTIISRSLKEIIANNYEFIVETSNIQSLPLFETNTIKKSQLADGLGELNHQVITQNQIYNTNVSTSAELLLLNPEVTIQKSSFAGGSPILRGFEANRVLLMVDGVRMNNAIYRSGHLQNTLTIDPFIMENCDIIFGPSAVTYGSDAIGGVVHYKTMSPILSKFKDSSKFSATYFSRINTASNEFSNHLNFQISKSRWASLSAITYKRFGNVKMGRNRAHGFNNWGLDTFSVGMFDFKDSMLFNDNPNILIGVGYSQIDLMNKILFTISSKVKVLLNSQFSSSSNMSRFDQLNNIENGVPQFSQWDYGPQIRSLNSLKLSITKSNTFFDDLTANFSHQLIEESRITRNFNSLSQNNRIETVNVFGSHIQFSKSLKTNTTLTYGTEIYYNNVNSNAFSLNIVDSSLSFLDTRYPDSIGKTFLPAFYTNINIKKPNFSIIGGLRYTWNYVYASYSNNYLIPLLDNKFKINKHSLSGALNMILYPSKDTKVFLEFSSGFRSPNIDDLGKTFLKNNFITIPNSDLVPEYAYNISLGFSKNYKSRNFSTNFRSSAFMTLLENTVVKEPLEINGSDFIYYDSVSYTILANQNGAKSLVYGLSAAINTVFFENIIFNTSICYTKGQFWANKLPLGHIPPLFGRVNLKYNFKEWDFSLRTLFNNIKKLQYFGSGNVDNQLEATSIGYPSWWVLDAQIGYSYSENSKLNVGVFNILDIHYKTFASGISSPGRSLMLSLKLAI